MVEHELGVGGSLADITDWGGKLVGTVARIAANIHVADHAATGEVWKTLVGSSALSRAIELAPYLVQHAIAAFALMGRPGYEEKALELFGEEPSLARSHGFTLPLD